MKNRNIDRDTKNKLLEEVKVRYDILNDEAKNQQAEITPPKEEANHSAEVHVMVDAKVQEQDVTLSPKNEATEANTIDVSAESFSQKHLRELEVIREKAAKAKSIKDRMSAFNNDTTVNYDPVAFAVSQNKSNSGKNIHMPSMQSLLMFFYPPNPQMFLSLSLKLSKLVRMPSKQSLSLPRLISINMGV